MKPETAGIIIVVGVAAFLCLLSFLFGIEKGKPELVGYGCDNTPGVIYAEEESDFPACVYIGEN